MTSLADYRSKLTKIRKARGADTPIGHRCSNILEQLEHWAAASGEHKIALGKKIELQMSEIEQLTAKDN